MELINIKKLLEIIENQCDLLGLICSWTIKFSENSQELTGKNNVVLYSRISGNENIVSFKFTNLNKKSTKQYNYIIYQIEYAKSSIGKLNISNYIEVLNILKNIMNNLSYYLQENKLFNIDIDDLIKLTIKSYHEEYKDVFKSEDDETVKEKYPQTMREFKEYLVSKYPNDLKIDEFNELLIHDKHTLISGDGCVGLENLEVDKFQEFEKRVDKIVNEPLK